VKMIKLAPPLFFLALLCAVGGREEEFSAPTPRGTPLSAAELFARGREDFERGDDDAAADYFLMAARKNPGCTLGFAQDASSLPTGCGDPAGPSIPLSRMLYRLGTIRRDRVKSGPASSPGRVMRAGAAFFQKAVEEGEDDVFRARAGLALVEAGLCMEDAGCPDCAIWAIESYEKWLKEYPRARERDEVTLRLAELYLDLAGRFEEQGRPWFNRAKAELGRGRALELAAGLVERPTDPATLGRARVLAQTIADSGKPHSIVPASAIPNQEK
jgi:hypothetical protein